jgi:abequosyltransferase
MNETVDWATPLLAVCIPTRNRREVLEECLESILPQANALGVGVVVSDNGSSDGTWHVLEAFKLQYPWMQIMHHTRDIGYRDNLTGAVLSSRAHYVWPIGDKLVLCPGALEFMTAELTRVHPDAVVVNGWLRLVGSVDEREYSTPQSCLTEVGWWTTCCGATVQPRQAFIDALRIQPLSREWPHVVALFSYLASLRAPRVLLSGRVLVQIGKSTIEKTVESSWTGHILETGGRNWYDAIMGLPALYSLNDKLRAVRSLSKHIGLLDLRNLIRLRARGQLTVQKLRADRIPLQAAISAPWWSALVIAATPGWILRPALHVHPRLALRAIRNRLRLPHGRTAHQVSK